MTRLAVICARGGSKGVPGKNIRPLGGRPLIAWTVGQAFDTGLFDLVVVSSDAPEILKAAAGAGPVFEVLRPAEMATDTSSVHPAILHALSAAEMHLGRNCESFAFLQTTSPLRAVDDIARGVALWETHRPTNVISVTPARASPYYTLLEEGVDGRVSLSKQPDPPFVRRQDAPLCWEINGALYVFDRDKYVAEPKVLYTDTLILEMPMERSVDIDTEQDLLLAEFLLQKQAASR